MGFLKIGTLAQSAAMGNVVHAQMPTADATLLPPPCSYASPEEAKGSSRHLEDVGVEAVLESMLEQKRRSSRPSFPSYPEMESGIFVKAR